MMRLAACLLIGLAGCGQVKDREPDNAADDPVLYESSGSVFFIMKSELGSAKQRALAGDNEQLQRVIDYYLFSHEPQDASAQAELQKWQEIAADRDIKNAAHNLLFMASEEAGPDCETLRKHSKSLSRQEQADLRQHSSYVDRCLSS